MFQFLKRFLEPNVKQFFFDRVNNYKQGFIVNDLVFFLLKVLTIFNKAIEKN